MTVGCAKCHDHMYDPITQRDFYAMKSLFDPLAIRKVTLASPAEIMAQSKTLDEAQKKRAAAQAPLDALEIILKRRPLEPDQVREIVVRMDPRMRVATADLTALLTLERRLSTQIAETNRALDAATPERRATVMEALAALRALAIRAERADARPSPALDADAASAILRAVAAAGPP